MTDLPEYLQQPPAPTQDYPPPVRERAQELPLGDMPWDEFEKLAMRLFAHELELVDYRLYGNPGQGQEGIDLYGASPTGQRHTAQCRRVRLLGPAEIRGLVDDFVAGPWAEASDSLVLFTTASARERRVADAIEVQRDRLAEAGVEFIVRDRERLHLDLKYEPDLVDDFFGEDYRRAFCPGESMAPSIDVPGLAREIAAELDRTNRRARVLDVNDLNAAVQRAIRVLAEHDESEVALLEPLLDDTRPVSRAAEWIAAPPADLAAASWQLWAVVTRIAERGGGWSAAADGWLRIASIREGAAELRAIVNASIAAGIGGDEELADELLGRAREIDPEHPKLRLQDVGKIDEPTDQLAALDGLESDDEDEEALIELNRALAHIRLNGFAEAERALRRAEQAGGERLTQLPVIRANLAVQRNRINASRGRPIDGRALEEAERECLDARQTLIGEHRFAESVRALMLAVDAVAIRTDFAGTEALLQLATEEEIDAKDGSGVLGDAALRCMVPRLALRFTERAPDSPERRRIRAAANLNLRSDVEANRAELRELALGGTDEAYMAAFALCRDAAFHQGPWDREAAAVLATESPIEAITLEAWHLTRLVRYEDARSLLEPHETEHWALQLRFTLADFAEHPDALELVPRVLASNPDRHQRLRCAAVLLRDNQGDRAEDAARQVAEDVSAPAAERSDGYDQLLKVLEADGRWADARRELEGWTAVDPTAERLNVWQVRVGNRLRRPDP
ncbi:MAG: hypothetical protein WD844_07950 [Thermoleophilaceae bacterium]